jgi:hypothetical protein
VLINANKLCTNPSVAFCCRKRPSARCNPACCSLLRKQVKIQKKNQRKEEQIQKNERVEKRLDNKSKKIPCQAEQTPTPYGKHQKM